MRGVVGLGVEGGGIEKKRKERKTHGHRQQCGDCGGRRMRGGGGWSGGINGDVSRLDLGW